MFKKFFIKSEKTSLKKNLIITLSSLLAVAITMVFLIGYFFAKNEITKVFDANLVKSAKLISSLIKHEILEGRKYHVDLDLTGVESQEIYHRYEYKIHSQIWNNDKLIYNSDKNYNAERPDYEGFKDVDYEGKNWRSFVIDDQKTRVKILVMEQEEIRQELTNEIILSLFLPLIFAFVPLFLIIVFTINKRLRPLEKMAQKIEKMSTKSLEKFSDNQAPLELEPFINSFNSLIEKLKDSMNLERRFTDYAAHELKTPLAAVKIQTQLLLKTKDAQKQKEYLQDLSDGIERMTHMINQLLTLTRLEPENNQIQRENFSLSSVINNIVAMYSQQMVGNKIILDFSHDHKGQEVLINANKTYIEIMVRNLLENAVKYSPDNGVIKVEILQNAQEIILVITNSGATIGDDDKAKLFDNFYRANIGSHQDKQGSGLGLAIVKKIAELHSAKIDFTSQNGVNKVEVKF